MDTLVPLPLSWASLPYPLEEQCFQEKSRLTLDQSPFHVISPITCLFLAEQLHFNAEEFIAYNSKCLFLCVIGSFFLLLLPMSFSNFLWRKWHFFFFLSFFLHSHCVSHFSRTPQLLTSYVFAWVTFMVVLALLALLLLFSISCISCLCFTPAPIEMFSSLVLFAITVQSFSLLLSAPLELVSTSSWTFSLTGQ